MLKIEFKREKKVKAKEEKNCAKKIQEIPKKKEISEEQRGKGK